MRHDKATVVRRVPRRLHAADAQIADRHRLQVGHRIGFCQARYLLPRSLGTENGQVRPLTQPVLVAIDVVPVPVRRQNVLESRVVLFLQAMDNLATLLNITDINRDQTVRLRFSDHVADIIIVEAVQVEVW